MQEATQTVAAAPPERHHCLTVALEDYYQVSAFARLIDPRQWSRFESRVERNTLRALDLLDEHGVRATFFTLGWIADHQPEIIREVARRGHEVATKGYYHRTLQQLTRGEFRDEVLRSRDAIENATGVRVVGHRIAQGSFTHADLWALDVLASEGFRYDSSFYPRLGTIASEPWRRFPHVHRCQGHLLWEVPLSAWGPDRFLLPLAGGNAFRQLPAAVSNFVLRDWNSRYAEPFTMYFNVWELDPDVPLISLAGPLTRLRQYRNLGKVEDRLRRQFAMYRFVSVARHLNIEPEPSDPGSRAAAVEQPEPPAVTSATKGAVPVTVVVPCYNEEHSLRFLHNALVEVDASMAGEYDLRLVFVDDCSSDNTWRLLHDLFGGWGNVRMLRHAENRGVAAAILTGIGQADSDIVCSIDCDCSYDPAQLRKMIPMLSDGVAMVTASPYHPDGQVRNVPGWRLALSRTLSLMYRRVLHHRFATYTSCFRVYRREAIEKVRISRGGFLGIAEMLARLDLAGERIVEFPAVLEVRMLGTSKMKTVRTILGHLRLLAELTRARLHEPMRTGS